jgi:SAM-dependent methyltransferase
MFVPGTTVTCHAELPSAKFAEDIARVYFGDDAPRGIIAEIREAFAYSVGFDNPIIATESAQFLSRFRHSGVKVSDPYPEPPRSPEPLCSINDPATGAIAVRLITQPSLARTGEALTFNVQIENVGSTILTSKVKNPFAIAFKLQREGGDCEIEGNRTALLVDIKPGRSVTQPIILECPNLPGVYRVDIAGIFENVRWLPTAATMRLEVSNETRSVEADVWSESRDSLDYFDDHRRAIGQLRTWLGETSAPPAFIVEVGGNFSPSCLGLGVPVVNVDIDPFGLMARSILDQGTELVTHVVADGCALPFPDGSVDVIAMFATFHHFPDPVGFLSHLKRKLRPSGRIYLLCEPIGHVFADSDYPEYFAELEAGVYEQSFMPWEYEQMLEAAGLEIVHAHMDPGSVKIAAERRQHHQM